MRRFSVVVSTALVTVALPVAAHAAPGDLDTTFDTDGRVQTAFTTNGTTPADVRGTSVLRQPDGKLVVAGARGNEGFYLARYNIDGSLDASFDGDGRARRALVSTSSGAQVLRQADGKLLMVTVAGNDNLGASRAVRFNADGSADNAYAGTGELTLPGGVQDALLDGAGRLVTINEGTRFSRYTTAGAPDTTFDGDGSVTHTVPGNGQLAYTVALQPDGKLVAGGYQIGGLSFAIRVNADGSRDDAFGTSGVARAGSNFFYEGLIDAGGRIYFGSGSGTVVRFTSAGQLDNDWSLDGIANVANFNRNVDGIAQESGGKIVVGGADARSGFSSAGEDFKVTRYDTDGTQDTGYGTSGVATADFGTNDRLRDLIVDADDKVVAAGSLPVSGNDQVAVARFNGGEPATPPETTITSGPSGTVGTPNAMFTFSSSQAGSTFRCRLDGGPEEVCSSPKTYTNVGIGQHTLSVRAFGPANQPDPTPAERTWRVQGPDTTITESQPLTTESTSARFSFATAGGTQAGDTFVCSLDAAAFTPCESPLTVSGLSAGQHSFRVAAVRNGLTDPEPAEDRWTIIAGGSTGGGSTGGGSTGGGSTGGGSTGGGSTGGGSTGGGGDAGGGSGAGGSPSGGGSSSDGGSSSSGGATAQVPLVSAPASGPATFSRAAVSNGTATLTLAAPGPGQVQVTLSTRGSAKASAAAKKKQRKKKTKVNPQTIGTGSATATAAGPVDVKVRLNATAKKALKRGGRLAVKATIRFTPTGGTASTTTRALNLKGR